MRHEVGQNGYQLFGITCNLFSNHFGLFGIRFGLIHDVFTGLDGERTVEASVITLS